MELTFDFRGQISPRQSRPARCCRIDIPQCEPGRSKTGEIADKVVVAFDRSLNVDLGIVGTAGQNSRNQRLAFEIHASHPGQVQSLAKRNTSNGRLHCIPVYAMAEGVRTVPVCQRIQSERLKSQAAIVRFRDQRRSQGLDNEGEAGKFERKFGIVRHRPYCKVIHRPRRSNRPSMAMHPILQPRPRAFHWYGVAKKGQPALFCLGGTAFKSRADRIVPGQHQPSCLARVAGQKPPGECTRAHQNR